VAKVGKIHRQLLGRYHQRDLPAIYTLSTSYRKVVNARRRRRRARHLPASITYGNNRAATVYTGRRTAHVIRLHHKPLIESFMATPGAFVQVPLRLMSSINIFPLVVASLPFKSRLQLRTDILRMLDAQIYPRSCTWLLDDAAVCLYYTTRHETVYLRALKLWRKGQRNLAHGTRKTGEKRN